MAVRNFWIEGRIDGKATPIGAGPAAKDGGFNLAIHQRHNGQITHPIRITGKADAYGELITTITVNGVVVATTESTR